MGGDLDGKGGSLPVSNLHGPGGTASGSDGGDPSHRTEDVHEGGEVVGADIEERTGPSREQELGVRMEHVRPGVLHHGLCGQWLADVAASDGSSSGLDALAEHRVWGDAEEHTG